MIISGTGGPAAAAVIEVGESDLVKVKYGVLLLPETVRIASGLLVENMLAAILTTNLVEVWGLGLDSGVRGGGRGVCRWIIVILGIGSWRLDDYLVRSEYISETEQRAN